MRPPGPLGLVALPCTLRGAAPHTAQPGSPGFGPVWRIGCASGVPSRAALLLALLLPLSRFGGSVARRVPRSLSRRSQLAVASWPLSRESRYGQARAGAEAVICPSVHPSEGAGLHRRARGRGRIADPRLGGGADVASRVTHVARVGAAVGSRGSALHVPWALLTSADFEGCPSAHDCLGTRYQM